MFLGPDFVEQKLVTPWTLQLLVRGLVPSGTDNFNHESFVLPSFKLRGCDNM
jgi:hypothetical protein